MRIYNNVYIGHVETINTDANVNEKVINSKVVLLKGAGYDENKIPKYKPLKKYSEYYRIVDVEPINGIISDNGLNKVIKNTGKEEVKVLKKTKKVA